MKPQYLTDILCFIYVFYFVLETTSYMAVSSNFTSSYMYLLIESNPSELKEFSSSYFNIPIVIFIISFIGLFFVIRKIDFKKKNRFHSVIGVFGVIVIIAVLKLTGLIESNAYHNVVRGTYGYFEHQNSMKFDSVVDKDQIMINSNNEVLVIVLGESTARGHMQIYGYERETTPLLSSIKDSLYIYNDVISTDVITTKALPLVLTSAFNGGKEKSVINIIDVFNKSGYKTYWLSNQRPIGFYDNKVSELASFSSYVKFLNHRDEVKTTSYDEVLLPELKRTLNTKGKKVVFIHLIGTHFNYKNRYPKAYNKFNSVSETSEKINVINQYDNAVFYNDYVVWSILSDLKKVNDKSAFIYLSDHGENVYDNGTDFLGRTETNLKPVMFEIPFIIWTSKDFELPIDFEYKPDRKFMADHTYESIGHLFGIKHMDMDFSKSIFSTSFKERKRNVVNGINYDTYFLENNE
ncbi:phosphoethanolamine transferase [Algibacter sp. L4_22]|uniref:phosphoethanolamine transferase n=1 Tax=Algibacter sp. L4_22 TaxID=2942477 RepID=UPI00201B607F|nr:phosphoethanolamine transferase [Algibacter sp. L4_22]MCL5129973.1 phosphoethanolamine transferase [Algibacter sp. L4_22]